VVERILEKRSSSALMLCEKPLNVSALRPRPDAAPLLSCEIDNHCLLFSNLPDSVTTDSFKKYLRRASPSDTGSRIVKQPMITSVIYSMKHHGIAVAVFKQPYGNKIYALLAKLTSFKQCIISFREIAVCVFALSMCW